MVEMLKPTSSNCCCNSSSAPILELVSTHIASSGAEIYPAPAEADLDRLFEILTIVLQHSTPNALHEPATFSQLLCINKQLQQSLLRNSARCLNIRILLADDSNLGLWNQHSKWDTADGFKRGYQTISDDTRFPPSTKKQLQWVIQQLEQPNGQIRQLTVWAEETWVSSSWFVERLVAAVPELASWGLVCPTHPMRMRVNSKDFHIRTAHDRPLVPFCHGVVIDFAPSCRPPEAPPAPAPLLHMRLAVALDEHCGHKRLHKHVLGHLCQLSNLQELHLHQYNPPAGALAPALSAMTALTKLFIRHPFPPEQQALPVMLRELTVGRQFERNHSKTPPRLLRLHLTHLTALEALTTVYVSTTGLDGQSSFDHLNMLPDVCEGVPAGSVLPASVQQLTVKGIRHVEPLLMLTQLKSLNITYMSSRSVTPDTLLAMSQLTTLTSVRITGKLPQFAGSGLHAYSPAFAALPVELSGLEFEYPPGS